MRSWSQSTFVFVSSNPQYDEGGVEDRWFSVMEDLIRRGSDVRFLCLSGSPAGERARALGVQVDPYVLDRWNVIRSRSRLRKYLKRFVPVAAHSTGLEADLILRWSARKVPHVEVVHTLVSHRQNTTRKRPIDALMRRFDELGMKSSAAVFVDAPELLEELALIGIPPEKTVLDPPPGDADSNKASVARHVDVYRRLLAGRGQST